jgi:hypothetical protein
MTLKRQQLIHPPDQIELAFLLSNCGLQASVQVSHVESLYMNYLQIL